MNDCKKYIYKANSIIENKKYYCTIKCYENSQDYLDSIKILENNMKNNKKIIEESAEKYTEIIYDPMEDF